LKITSDIIFFVYNLLINNGDSYTEYKQLKIIFKYTKGNIGTHIR